MTPSQDFTIGMKRKSKSLRTRENAATMQRADLTLMHAPDPLARKLGDQLILARRFEKANVPLEFVTTGGVGD
jgi:hypothetical protein